MATYKELSAQIAALMQQADAARRVERNNAIAEIRSTMAEYGITIEDLDGGRGAARRSTAGTQVPPKYRNAAGDTWTGRGKRPRWLASELAAGKTIEEFLIL